VDELMLAQLIYLSSTINGLDNMGIGDGDGITIPQPLISSPDDSPTANAGKSNFARATSGFGLRLSPKSPAADDILEGTSSTSQSGIFGKLTKRLVNTSKNTVKAL
jgi:phosphatidylinositol-3,4,5-trisphosphate 3-phosphatase/dual-specificity protein phosphatase PTEN